MARQDLTMKQYRFLECYPGSGTIKETLERADVSWQSWKNWRKQPLFLEKFNALRDARYDGIFEDQKRLRQSLMEEALSIAESLPTLDMKMKLKALETLGKIANITSVKDDDWGTPKAKRLLEQVDIIEKDGVKTTKIDREEQIIGGN